MASSSLRSIAALSRSASALSWEWRLRNQRRMPRQLSILIYNLVDQITKMPLLEEIYVHFA